MAIHNLDDGISEYFEFTLKGYNYRFRHLTTDEVVEFQKIANDEEKVRSYLYTFIDPLNDAPPFTETARKMLVPHWKRFIEMVKTEFGII